MIDNKNRRETKMNKKEENCSRSSVAPLSSGSLSDWIRSSRNATDSAMKSHITPTRFLFTPKISVRYRDHGELSSAQELPKVIWWKGRFFQTRLEEH